MHFEKYTLRVVDDFLFKILKVLPPFQKFAEATRKFFKNVLSSKKGKNLCYIIDYGVIL